MARDKNLDLNAGGSLPEGSSLQGATRNSMGNYSTADVKRGWGDGTYQPPMEDDGTAANCSDLDCPDELPKPYGFLGRAQGWER